jgi:hypothetical protein
VFSVYSASLELCATKANTSEGLAASFCCLHGCRPEEADASAALGAHGERNFENAPSRRGCAKGFDMSLQAPAVTGVNPIGLAPGVGSWLRGIVA